MARQDLDDDVGVKVFGRLLRGGQASLPTTSRVTGMPEVREQAFAFRFVERTRTQQRT